MKEQTAMNRRTFLKGALIGSAGLGMTAMAAGCASGKPAEAPLSDTGDAEGAKSSAPSATGGASWEKAPEPIAADEIVATQDFDVVVVGAGIAGATTFMRACESGLKAALVEKTETFNARGMDCAAIGTKVQKEAGITVDKAKVINDLVVSSGYKVNGDLIKTWADESGRVFDDLTDMMTGMGYTVEVYQSDTSNMEGDGCWYRTYPVTHNFGVAELGNGVCNQTMVSASIDRGLAAGGEVFYSMPAVQLITDDSGAVVGVVCQGADGYVQYNAPKGVVLATGDFAGNPDMVEKWAPMLKETAASVYNPAGANTGDHVNMAFWVGGSMQKGSAAAMVHPIMGGGACGTYAFMRVNKDGKRFCNEDAPLPGITNAYMTSPGHVVWTVMDADFASELDKMTLLSQYSGSTSGPFDPTLGYTPAEQMEMCLESGTSVTGNTLEELAEAMGVPAGNLAAAVARYNELAEKGADEDFGKDAANLFPIAKAPFYASQVTAALLSCASGLNVDSAMNVCSAEGEAIQGLYAVGNAAGNFFSNDYPMVCPGISHGRCLTLGYVLGEQLAK